MFFLVVVVDAAVVVVVSNVVFCFVCSVTVRSFSFLLYLCGTFLRPTKMVAITVPRHSFDGKIEASCFKQIVFSQLRHDGCGIWILFQGPPYFQTMIFISSFLFTVR